MRSSQLGALGVLVGAVVLVLSADSPVHSQRAPVIVNEGGAKPPIAKDSITAEIAAKVKVPEEIVVKVLDALGPAVRDHLARGEEVPLPGLGTFRVVKIGEHKDLVDGRPATIPARNTVEFLPGGGMAAAANAPGAKPADVVLPFEYNTLPDQVKSQHVGSQRTPNTRTR
jgi:nucleoid DNA-binding protein